MKSYGFGFGFNIVHGLGLISNLRNLMDSDLDSILFMGWVGFQTCEILWIRIWVWIHCCSWVGSDFKSVKSYGFGFGFGFNVVHGLGRISNP